MNLVSLFPNVDFPFYTFWQIVGIILSLLYYTLVAHRFSFKWYIGLGIGVIIILSGYLGAKLLAVVEVGPSVFASWTGGFSFFGALIFLPIILLLCSFIFKIKYLKLLDFMSVGVLIVITIFRIGCLFAGCCHGIEWPWGISDGNGGYYFPAQPLEIILDAIATVGVYLLFRFNLLKKGEMFYLFYISYGSFRFVIEFYRERTPIFGDFSLSHIFAFLAIIIPLTLLIIGRLKDDKSKEEINEMEALKQ